MSKQGKLLIISGFSGVGKGTVVNKLIDKYDDYTISISATTRKERKVTTILSHMTRSNMYLFREQMMNHSLLYRMPLTEVARLRQVPE